MGIRVTTDPEAITDDVLRYILRTTTASKSLTPRSAETLQQLITTRSMAVALYEGHPIGWLIREQLTKDVQELGMAYVVPEYRRRNILKHLIAALEDPTQTQLFATYTPDIVTYMQKTHGFLPANLLQVAHVSKGTFIFRRLGYKKAASISKRLKDQKAYYAMRRATK